MDADSLLIHAGLKKSDHVLEVGCGPGFFTIPAAEIVGEEGKVYAIDINPFAIKKVEKKIARTGTKNVVPMIVDVTKTTLEDNSIDNAFFFGVIHSLICIIDDVTVEMHRILKNNGVIAIQKSRKSKKELIELVTQNNIFKFSEEKDRVLIFNKIE